MAPAFPAAADVIGVERTKGKKLSRCLQWGCIALAVALAGIVLESARGHRNLAMFRKELISRGEILEASSQPNPGSNVAVTFSSNLTAALALLPAQAGQLAARVSGVTENNGGIRVRGSRQPAPMHRDKASPFSWAEAARAIDSAEPALQLLQRVLKAPPSYSALTLRHCLQNEDIPRMAGWRRAAQALHAAAIVELHRGNHSQALNHIQALAGCARIHESDTTLVSYMMRMATIGLLFDACWDALQDEDWSDEDLARFQHLCATEATFAQLPQVLETERIARLYTMQRFQRGSYNSWLTRCEELYRSFGMKLHENDASWTARPWRHWVFHPVWQVAWSEQEELEFLTFSQSELAGIREGVRLKCWIELQRVQHDLRKTPRPAWNDWRFYNSIPLQDSLTAMVGAERRKAATCPYPDYSRAFLVVAENLTLQEMAQTVAALKRYRLRFGTYPESLISLVPMFITSPPRDLINGEPLRYRRSMAGQFTLYSVAENGRDDNGVQVGDWTWQHGGR